jgi:tetratricopeptide (TPR) repeat protein
MPSPATRLRAALPWGRTGGSTPRWSAEGVAWHSRAQLVASLNATVAELYSQQRYEQALPQATAAVEVARLLPPAEHAELGAALNNLAELYRTIGNPEAAEPLYLEALDVARRTVGEESIDYAACLNNLALLYFTTSRYNEARPPADTACEIRRRLLETGDPQLENSLLLLSMVYQQLGEPHDAGTYRTLAAESARETCGSVKGSSASGGRSCWLEPRHW